MQVPSAASLFTYHSSLITHVATTACPLISLIPPMPCIWHITHHSYALQHSISPITHMPSVQHITHHSYALRTAYHPSLICPLFCSACLPAHPPPAHVAKTHPPPPWPPACLHTCILVHLCRDIQAHPGLPHVIHRCAIEMQVHDVGVGVVNGVNSSEVGPRGRAPRREGVGALATR